jgi:hypothetical protein
MDTTRRLAIKARCYSIERIPMQHIQLEDYSPAPMHVFMGIVNDIVKREWREKIDKHPTINNKEYIRNILYYERIYFERHCSHSMSGGAVKDFLNKRNEIVDAIAWPGPSTHLFRSHYKALLTCIHDMYITCMSVKTTTLSDDDIDSFKRATLHYITCRKSVMLFMHGNEWHRPLTPKEHTLVCHFEPFMRRHRSLGRYSEQAHEAVHHTFNVAAAKLKSEHDIVDKMPLVLRMVNEQNLYRSRAQ